MFSLLLLQAVYSEGLTTKHIEERRKDHISHYILRLAYCRTWGMGGEREGEGGGYVCVRKREAKNVFYTRLIHMWTPLTVLTYITSHYTPTHTSADMRRWLLSQETELLRYRYLSANKRDKDDFFLFYKDDFNMETVDIPHPDNSCWDDLDDPHLRRVSIIKSR